MSLFFSGTQAHKPVCGGMTSKTFWTLKCFCHCYKWELPVLCLLFLFSQHVNYFPHCARTEVILPLCSVRTVVLICTQHSRKKPKWNSCKETSHASNSRIKLLQPYRKLHRKKRCRQPILAQWAQAAAAFRGSFFVSPTLHRQRNCLWSQDLHVTSGYIKSFFFCHTPKTITASFY